MCISVRRSGVKWRRRIHSTRCQAAWHGDTPPKSQTRRYLDSIIAVRLVRQPHRRSAEAGSPRWVGGRGCCFSYPPAADPQGDAWHDVRGDWSWWETERNGNNKNGHRTAVTVTTVMYVFSCIHRSRVAGACCHQTQCKQLLRGWSGRIAFSNASYHVAHFYNLQTYAYFSFAVRLHSTMFQINIDPLTSIIRLKP